MALAQGVFLVAQIADIRESSGLPPGTAGNPREVDLELQANPNRAPLHLVITMDRSLTGGLQTGDLVKVSLTPATDADQAAFEAAVVIGTHVLAAT